MTKSKLDIFISIGLGMLIGEGFVHALKGDLLGGLILLIIGLLGIIARMNNMTLEFYDTMEKEVQHGKNKLQRRKPKA